MTLKPAKEGTGVLFVRSDVPSERSFIRADYRNVTDTSLCTKLSNEYRVSIGTVEHLSAAIWGCGIDNIIVEVDGPEIPVMDGSSKAFVFMIKCAGIKYFSSKRRAIKITKEVVISSDKCEVIVMPYDNCMRVEMNIDFESKVIGKQSNCIVGREDFLVSCADARTFGFVNELEYLRKKGLAKGASLDNAIGIDGDVVLNHDGLRYDDEFVRHKILDAVGDFALSGINIHGMFVCNKSGHGINNLVLHKIFENDNCYAQTS
jgi:UDP-3-O-[3-hydroxymyristoyl] N-acetylglucosamine deacetylase